MNLAIRALGPALAAGFLLLLAGCATPGNHYGGQGGSPGGYGQSAPGYPAPYASELQGTVDGVDSGYGRILLVVDDPRTGRADRNEVRYDQRTRLFYRGEEYPVEGLERGDVIRIQLAESGRDLWAQTIEVVHNIRDGNYRDGYGGGYDRDYGYGNAYGQDFRGEVADVDARARLIRLVGGRYGSDVQLAYDGRTTVEYQGRSYRPEDMQYGDLVRVQARRVGGNQWLAERIFVERAAR